MYSYAAKLVRCIDGDSVVLDLDLGFKLWRKGESYRLGRIDAPEMSTAAGPVSKRVLEEHLMGGTSLVGKSLSAVTSKADKYGRFVVELFADNVNVNDWLVANGQAVYRTY